MKIHEYQAKELFKDYNIQTPKGFLAYQTDEAMEFAENLGFPCVIKAQVHSGARGKAGGIKLAKNLDEAKAYSNQIIGMKLKSIQTGDEAKTVSKVLIEQGVNIDKELYISLTVNREDECITIITSSEGGMDIEEVAHSHPEAIIKTNIYIENGIQAKDLDEILKHYNYSDKVLEQFANVIQNLYRLFIEKDCSLVEINPLVVTKEEEVIAIDGKINFDDNALFRHPDIVELRDLAEENPLEVEASKHNLNYIKLDGTIGCMVNGAGLAMTTMDIIKLAGKSPANFLDVGGGASSEMIENAFRILLSDKNIEKIFINIFGGILRCDILAQGLENAVKKLNTDIPIIVRMEGTNKEEGAKILNSSGLEFSVATDLNHAIELIK